MKKITFLVLYIIFFSQNTQLYAATPTPSHPSPTSSSVIKKTVDTALDKASKALDSAKKVVTDPVDAELEKIQKIKEKIASKVAELKLVEKRGILGYAKDVSSVQIIAEDVPNLPTSEKKLIDIDELTKFQDSAGSGKSFGISDIKPGDFLSFVGLYNKDTKRLLARVITKVQSIPFFTEGIVTEKNSSAYTLKIIDEKGNAKIISIESSTKTQLFQKGEDLTRSGFTKIVIGQRLFVAGFIDKKEKDTINATRVIHFKDLPPSYEMKKFQASNSTEEIPVSTGSGKKLTPIKR